MLGKLTKDEILIFKELKNIPQKNHYGSNGGLKGSAYGYGVDDINEYMKKSNFNMNTLQLIFDSLESHNFIRRQPLPGNLVYQLTKLGDHIAQFL